MQKRLNTFFKISSLVILPVISAKEFIALRISSDSNSSDTPISRASTAACNEVWACRNASKWRIFDTTTSPL